MYKAVQAMQAVQTVAVRAVRAVRMRAMARGDAGMATAEYAMGLVVISGQDRSACYMRDMCHPFV